MNKKLPNGFTLLELVIYLALFPVLLSSVLLLAFAMNSSLAMSKQKALETAEAMFVWQKIEYAMQNKSVMTPILSQESSTLTLKEAGMTEQEIFSNENGFILLKHGQQQALPLNTSQVKIHDFKVRHEIPHGQTQEIIIVEFYIDDQFFSFEKYLQL